MPEEALRGKNQILEIIRQVEENEVYPIEVIRGYEELF